MDFGGGDGWVMSQDYAMHALVYSLVYSWGKPDQTAEWRKQVGDVKLFKGTEPKPTRGELK